jgi:serine/threonine protein kinase
MALQNPAAVAAAAEEDIGACTLDQRKLTINKRWRITEKLASGGFGAIYKAQDKDTNEVVVVKTERRIGKNYLDREAEVFKKMHGQEGFPSMIWRGKIYYKENKKRKGCSSIIMDHLGYSLSDLFYKHGKRFSLKTTLMLADQMIKRLQQLHATGIIHRDIKPGNFVMGTGARAHIVYLIDFGLANFFVNSDGSHMGYRTDAPFRGTHRYASINAHFKIEQSRRDDLEGLGYVLIYFLRGGLPWQNVNCSRRRRRKVIGDSKKSVSLEQLCEGIPIEFLEYMQLVRTLQYDSSPDYKHLRKLFKRCFRREGFKKDFVYDWSTFEPTSDAASLVQSSIGASDSSVSTLEDDGVPRPLYNPNALKRIHDEDDQGENEDQPPAKRQRVDVGPPDPHANVVLISSVDEKHDLGGA